MGTSVNCSFTDQNNVYHSLFCGTSNPYCCTSGLNQTCSANVCDAAGSSPSIESQILFWMILAGVGASFLLVILVTYLICWYRKPRDDDNDAQSDVFEETICETQIRTVTTRKLSARDINRDLHKRTENTRLVTSRFKSRLPVRVVSRLTQTTPDKPTVSSTKWDNSTFHSPREFIHGRSDSSKMILEPDTHLPDVNM